ncbi:hypothetical protein CLOM_g23418 [Closterium sp. NIES-68]|nr:hypothetical protein CLOM_g23418 [Closterium sp. NIES-68]GJP61223.1 hypothetical protein CLOP_g18409 [Closterium sp. NIES-67]GJP62246.1 hypothetical protein CLOP_g19330 [Closterium sp. NIES-67]
MALGNPFSARASCPSSLVTLFVLVALLVVAHQASAANLPLDGCQCGKLRGLERARINAVNFRRFEQLGSFSGAFNSHGGRLVPHQHGSGSVNLEVYQEVGNYVEVVRGRQGATLEGCCAACAASPLCFQYHWFNSAQQRRNANVRGFVGGAQCYLLGEDGGAGVGGHFKTPYSGEQDEQRIMAPYFPQSWVGGICNSSAIPASPASLPHPTQSDLATLDPDSQLSNTFCLLSDRRIHVNIRLTGYHPDRLPALPADPLSAAASSLSLRGQSPPSTGAQPRARGSPGLRAWIKEVGVVWVGHEGRPHTLRLVARGGKQQARGREGFLSLVEMDGVQVAVPVQVGAAAEGGGGLVVAKVAEEKEGAMDVDQYAVMIQGLAELNVRVRVAHPLLQSVGEAEAHFILEFMDLQPTPAVHGVLGQTFRDTPDGRHRDLTYAHLAGLLHRPEQGGEGADGFLEGSSEDYVTSAITRPDCAFSAFPSIPLPA